MSSVKCDSLFNDHSGYEQLLQDFSYSGLSDINAGVVDTISISKQLPIGYPFDKEEKIPFTFHFPADLPQEELLAKSFSGNLLKPFNFPAKSFLPHSYNLENTVPPHTKPPAHKLFVPEPYDLRLEKHFSHPIEKYVSHPIKFPLGRPFPVHITVGKPLTYHLTVKKSYHVVTPKPRLVTLEKKVPVIVNKPAKLTVKDKVRGKKWSLHEENHSDCGCQS